MKKIQIRLLLKQILHNIYIGMGDVYSIICFKNMLVNENSRALIHVLKFCRFQTHTIFLIDFLYTNV